MTAGATEAIAAAMLALVRAGRRGRQPSSRTTTRTRRASRWPVRDAVRDARARPTRLRPPTSCGARSHRVPSCVLLNSPHNPTGKVFARDELGPIAELAIDHDLLVVTDEVYEHLVFDGAHVPLATLPGMRERTVTISSAGKTFSFTGWKVGWVCGAVELVGRSDDREAVPHVRQRRAVPVRDRRSASISVTTTTPASSPGCGTTATGCATGLADVGFDVFVPQGTYFVTTDIRPLGADDGIAFCRSLPRTVRRRRGPERRVLRRQGGRRTARTVGMLQAARGARRSRRPPEGSRPVRPDR